MGINNQHMEDYRYQTKAIIKPLSRKYHDPKMLLNRDAGTIYSGYSDEHLNMGATEINKWPLNTSPYEICGVAYGNDIILSSVNYTDIVRIPYFYFRQNMDDHVSRFMMDGWEEGDAIKSIMNVLIHKVSTQFLFMANEKYFDCNLEKQPDRDAPDKLAGLLTCFLAHLVKK